MSDSSRGNRMAGEGAPDGTAGDDRRHTAPPALVLKAYSNFAEVLHGGERLTARMRGKMRLEGTSVLTGDHVDIERLAPGKALILDIMARRTVLVRPPVANVDLAIIVFTTESPPQNPALVDRLLILAQHAGLDALLCLNKIDLAKPNDLAAVRRAYGDAGVPLVFVSAVERTNLDHVVSQLGARVAVLAGQSGVGKSTLLNAILPGAGLEVGDLSVKVQRGRHTTRNVELLAVGSGWIADAPGFVQLDLPDIAPERLQDYYPEFASAQNQTACRFADCRHDREPGCSVKDAVATGHIDEGRYLRYLEFLHELQARPRY